MCPIGLDSTYSRTERVVVWVFASKPKLACHGLVLETNVLITSLRTDTFNWPTPTCQFPDWMTGIAWRDVTGDWRYVIDRNARAVIQLYRRQPSSSPPPQTPPTPPKMVLDSAARCIETIDYYRLDEEYIFLGFTTQQWSVGVFQIVRSPCGRVQACADVDICANV